MQIQVVKEEETPVFLMVYSGAPQRPFVILGRILTEVLQ
jgi:hypothetical protein